MRQYKKKRDFTLQWLFFYVSTYLQRIRDLEDKTEIQRRQIKDLEEKVGNVAYRPAV